MPTKYKGSPKQKRALNAFISLMRSSESTSMSLNQKNKIEGLSIAQFSILECLYHIGPMKAGELADKVFMSNANITYTVGTLFDKKLLDRVNDKKDRRVVNVELTKKGVSVVEDNLNNYVGDIVKIMDGISVQEQNTLREICRKLGKS